MDAMLCGISAPSMQRKMLGFFIVDTIWSGVCVIAMWRRQSWGRYLLVIRLMVAVCANGIDLLGLSDVAIDKTRLVWIISFVAGQLIVAVVLIASRDISKLTKPDLYQDS